MKGKIQGLSTSRGIGPLKGYNSSVTNNLMWLFSPHCPTFGITVVLPDKIFCQHHLSVFCFHTLEFSDSKIGYLASNDPDTPWIKKLIPFLVVNNYTKMDNESVISGQMLIHRKIIESDIWQQSIFSKTVRVQLCCWSWAVHLHNVWED